MIGSYFNTYLKTKQFKVILFKHISIKPIQRAYRCYRARQTMFYRNKLKCLAKLAVNEICDFGVKIITKKLNERRKYINSLINIIVRRLQRKIRWKM